MKVFLANPPWTIDGRYGVRAGSRWPFTLLPEEEGYISYIPYPFFLAYAAAVLMKQGKDILLVDAIAEKINNSQFLQRIKAYSPDVIILEVSTLSIKTDLLIAQKIKDELKNSVRIGLCGPHASVFPKEILEENSFVDYILIGEYEYILLDLVNYLEKSTDLSGVLGLAYRKKDGTAKMNNLRLTIENLDELPRPAYNFLPMDKYSDSFAGLPRPNVQMWTSRGCPYRCIFCLWPQVMYREHRHRRRDPAAVVDEMEWLIKEYNFKAVYFDDDTFNIDRKYVLEMCDKIKRKRIKIPWAAMARADLMDKELLESMAEAGLYAIKYGIESGNQQILDFCEKNVNLKKEKKMIEITKELGIKVHLAFMIGLPGENKTTINDTVNFFLKVKPNSVQFSIATPFPGTKYFSYLERKGYLISKNWSDYDGNYKSVTISEYLSAQEIEAARKEVSEVWENFSKECQN